MYPQKGMGGFARDTDRTTDLQQGQGPSSSKAVYLKHLSTSSHDKASITSSSHRRRDHHHQSHRKLKRSMYWFRKGLRLSDNPALLRAVERCESWRCIFILDPRFAGFSNQGINKWRFLLQSLEDLDRSLRKLNSRLYVIRGQPTDVLPQLFRNWNINYFSFEKDPEPFGQVRDKKIMAMCKEMGITVVSEGSHTLYNLDKVIELNAGKPPLTYRHFIQVISGMKEPPVPVPALSSRMVPNTYSPVSEDHDEKWGVPSLEELGFNTNGLRAPLWGGGESEALRRLERHLERKAWVASFGRPKMTPQSLLASETGLSPYLRFGCLSPRLFYHALGDLYRKIKKEEPPVSLYGQLLWNEFFYAAAAKNPNFDRMYGNPICVQIPWDKNAEALAKWANGRTGFPWIDAIMTQLKEEGWIHHLARHAVACFLTRGDLWISWEEGMKVFDELLLDADWSVNAGTWMWLSCSSFFQQFFHLYCPVKFGRKADPNGDFIRRYLPVLKNFPTRFIHEPWMATDQVQKAAKCVVGKDYPLPMVDHATVAKINQERMRQVYRHLASYRSSKMPESLCTVTSPQVTTSSCYEHSSPPATQQSPVITSNSRSSISVGTYSNEHQTYFPPPLPPPPLPSTSTAEPFMLQEAVSSAVTATGPSTSSVVDGADENDVDSLVPSIKSYQPQVVRATLQRDGLLQQAERGYSLSESERVRTGADDDLESLSSL